MIKKIKGVVKKYDWGGAEYLAELLGEENSNEPWAEYWLGTHPLGNSLVTDEQHTGLSGWLGMQGKPPLPFLLKILDVQQMLSIQLHPGLEQARLGYEQEEAKGLARDAYHRTYKDQNHKPELMVALSEFWLVQGFKKKDEITSTLAAISSFEELLQVFEVDGLSGLYRHIMTAEQEAVNRWLKPLGKNVKPAFESGILKKDDINYWAAKAFLAFNRPGVCDRGIISLYLMNLIKLNSGEGIFQAPGVLHAYLEGRNVECMANSDNVIRGGLTAKYIDRKELLKIVRYDHGHSEIIKSSKIREGLEQYKSEAKEFNLHIFSGSDTEMHLRNTGILLVLSGRFSIKSNGENIHLRAGESAIVLDSEIKIDSEQAGQLVIVEAGQDLDSH